MPTGRPVHQPEERVGSVRKEGGMSQPGRGAAQPPRGSASRGRPGAPESGAQGTWRGPQGVSRASALLVRSGRFVDHCVQALQDDLADGRLLCWGEAGWGRACLTWLPHTITRKLVLASNNY